MYTFRLNPCACAPYNADFDGDEMNIHVPQSIITSTELSLIADLTKQIIAPRSSQVIIKPIHDSVAGMYILSTN